MHRLLFSLALLGASASALAASASTVDNYATTQIDPDDCPGYDAQNVSWVGDSRLTADLVLRGPCALFGTGAGAGGKDHDVERLKLEVVVETQNRVHLKITDPTTKRFEVPESVFPRPSPSRGPVDRRTADLRFTYTASPFSFTISRSSSNETIFSTSAHPLIFHPQYVRVKTSLPQNPNIYGLGEHTEAFRLDPTTSTVTLTRTFWARDAFGIPQGTNLYGTHPIYFEHRVGGTHGVMFLSSEGMDVKISKTTSTDNANEKWALEYTAIGGIVDLYFLSGNPDTTSHLGNPSSTASESTSLNRANVNTPIELAKQYAQLVGLPAEVPYWSFGLHQCRFGYQNFVDVAEVIGNYSEAGIPLETMWTDIDYMHGRRIFTLDPDYFPKQRMRDIVKFLHERDQKFVLMTDPAVAYTPQETGADGYLPYTRGTTLDVWLKATSNSSGSVGEGGVSLGLVWPGVTVYPDWFHPKAQDYWTNEFKIFYDPEDGIDIDGAWIDMNEPASFCNLPCTDIFDQAVQQALPPPRSSPPPDPNTPIFGGADVDNNTKRGETAIYRQHIGLNRRQSEDDRDVLNPPYAINNAAGALSSKTAFVDAIHANGVLEYDAHNLYGTMMSTATRNAMLARRPGLRTLVITRSTFAGAGSHVGKWLGDNVSAWDQYRKSIAGMLGMASVFQVPMVGSDICGYSGNTTETLCARWAMLGAFYPFMRNHNSDTSISQEYYRWPLVTEAAKNAIDIRYRLLDYLYTAFHQAHLDGTPVVHPLWFKYPKDPATFALDLQFFFGDSVLVSPVTQENTTSVSVYLPHDIFYDFHTLAPVQGEGSTITLDDIPYTQIPLHIKGGTVLPLRARSAMTTTALRREDFEFVVAIGVDGKAEGALYVDDGVSIQPASSTNVKMSFGDGRLDVRGTFGFKTGVAVQRVRFLGVQRAPKVAQVNGRRVAFEYEAARKVLDVSVGLPLNKNFWVSFA
ncbi:glycoside hydrolase family 31 protein [Pleurotus ostreatus PC15]|uniref:beta-glucosidase n=1 Tax=Pleurotus ostreatus (strain PC15) TaxID=1137138 RepID=A0A067PE74_PLEO1|nr:glycoside hydrolase family 31 protein [Pleurotus ostreatus PC15]